MSFDQRDFDQVLTRLAGYSPQMTNGFYNHLPMAAEALVGLGHPHRAAGWVDAHLKNLQPLPEPKAPIRERVWRDALSDPGRNADWIAFFETRIAELGWRSVVWDWVDRFAPAMLTAANHAVIQTGHAVRSLSRSETPARKRELAHALAAWAVFHRQLNIPPLVPTGELDPQRALADVSLLDPVHRPGPGSITAGLLAVHHAPTFLDEVSRVRLNDDPARAVDELIHLFADLFLRTAHDEFTAIVFCHAVTGAAAVRNLLPVISRGTAQKLVLQAWIGGAAMKTVFTDEAPVPTAPDVSGMTPEALAAAAIDHGDDHVIKLTDALLTVYRAHGSANLLRAALRMSELMEREG